MVNEGERSDTPFSGTEQKFDSRKNKTNDKTKRNGNTKEKY